MTTTAWSRCATGVTKGRCGGDHLGPPASSCPPPRTSGGAFPCGSSTAPLFSAIPVSVSGLSFHFSRAGWVVGFLYVRVCQRNMVTWCCFHPSAGMRWRALINQVEPLIRRCWAFIIWLTLSWMGPAFSLTQLPTIPSLWYVFFPQREWQWRWLKGSYLARGLQNRSKVNSLKISPLNRKGEIVSLFLNPATPA